MKKILIIGAGLYGCCASIELKKEGYDVVLVDKEEDIMMAASLCNHNRIHYGYHYPRSYKTALESITGLENFRKMFKEAMIYDFPNYYFVEKNSATTAKDFISFSDKLGFKYTKSKVSNNIVDNNHIDLTLRVKEPIYDYTKVKEKVKSYLKKYKVELRMKYDILEKEVEEYDHIINATYGNINKINSFFNQPLIEIKLQDVIIPIFEAKMEKLGLTIMDGPYCSIMPKGFEKNKFLLYHVKYSVLKSLVGKEININQECDIEESVDKVYTNSETYYPFLNNVKRIGYYRSLRPLPINDDDERTVEIFYDKNNPKYLSVLSGKVTNCWTTATKIREIIQEAA